jgi:GTPase SAR1 family protein
VVFLGSDGSGKSSVIERVMPDLTPAFRKTSFFHLRPRFGIQNNNGNIVNDPHGKAPRSYLISITKLIYFWADYLFGWLGII